MSWWYAGFWLFLAFLNIVFFGISLEVGNTMMAFFNLSVAACCILSIISKKMMMDQDPDTILEKMRAKNVLLKKIRTKRTDHATVRRAPQEKEEKEEQD